MVELFTQKFVQSNSDVIIAVVGQLTFSEQQLLLRIKKEQLKGNKRLIVLHNLYNFEKRSQVEDHINNILKKSQTFTLEEKHYVEFVIEETVKPTEVNDVYYHENEKGNSIEHLIFARDDTEAGDFYNTSSKRFLRELLTATTSINRIDLIKKIQLFLKGILENEIQKDYINYSNNKIFVDESYPNPIIFKKIQVDSLSVMSFYGRAYQPKFKYYVIPRDSAPECIKEKLKSNAEAAEREMIFVVIIDIPSLKKTKKGTIPIPRIDNDDGLTYVTIKGKRSIKEVTTEKRISKNSSAMTERDYKLTFIVNAEDIFLNTAILIEQTYEKGMLTFYYAYHDLNNDKGEDLN